MIAFFYLLQTRRKKKIMVQLPNIKLQSEDGQKIHETTENKPKLAETSEKENSTVSNFDAILSQIRDLLEGKEIATTDINILKKKITENFEVNASLTNEKSTGETTDNSLAKNLDALPPNVEKLSKIHSELTSVSLGLDTQIITTSDNKADVDQIVKYAKKIGLNDKAIKLLFDKEGDKKTNTSNLKDGGKSTRTLELQTNLKKVALEGNKRHLSAEKEKILNKSGLNETDDKLSPKSILKTEYVNLKDKPHASQTSIRKFFNSPVEEELKSEKMLMKMKNELSIEKLLIKKLKDTSDFFVDTKDLKIIDLKNALSNLIKTSNLLKNNEIQVASANLQTEQYFFSLSSNSSINSSTDNTSFQNNNQNNGKDANADSAILKRQEQYQQLSEKLGESVARRIINQIARGTWNIQLALKPASLGTIEINLKLRGNEIEASFHANQAYTRELLTDGLPRLRDVLEKSGINVAHVDINDKKQDKNDGSSTEKDKSNYVVKEKSNESSIEDNKDKPKPKDFINMS